MATLGLTRELYFITSTVVDWMDVFTRPVYKQIIVESLRYCQAQKGLDIYAWVLMTNHLHLLLVNFLKSRNMSLMEVSGLLTPAKR